MAEIDDAVIEEAVHEGETTSTRGLVGLIERYHDDRAGVPRETVAAYARALADRRDYSFDAEGFLETVDSRLTDDESWAGTDRLYRLGDGRISLYPARWHDELGGSTDPVAYLRFLGSAAPEFAGEFQDGGVSPGVPEGVLVDLLRVIGRTDRESAAAAISDARADGALGEAADQHPNAGVYLDDESAADGSDRTGRRE